jgi:hypothetical protein
VLFSIGAAFRSRVLYFAGYKLIQDRYKVDETEHSADCVVWCCDAALALCQAAHRTAPLSATLWTRSRPMAAVAEARQARLKRPTTGRSRQSTRRCSA